jgi:hypothetical protein
MTLRRKLGRAHCGRDAPRSCQERSGCRSERYKDFRLRQVKARRALAPPRTHGTTIGNYPWLDEPFSNEKSHRPSDEAGGDSRSLQLADALALTLRAACSISAVTASGFDT